MGYLRKPESDGETMTTDNQTQRPADGSAETLSALNTSEQLTLEDLCTAWDDDRAKYLRGHVEDLDEVLDISGWRSPVDADEHRSLLSLWGKELVEKHKNDVKLWRISERGISLLTQASANAAAAGGGKPVFREGDTVSKINSNLSDKIQDGELGIVKDQSSEWVSVLFVGQPHELLITPDKLEVMYTTETPPMTTTTERKTTITAEELVANLELWEERKDAGEVACLVCGKPSGTALCADCEQLPKQTTERKTTITAAQFVSEGYTAKIERGECVVIDETPYHTKTDHQLTVREIIPPGQLNRHLHSCDVIYWHERDGRNYGWANVDDRTKLTVTWLPTEHPPASPAPETVAEGAAGWYYSSVVQWIPEYSTEKINGYDGPFATWQDALEACFKELDEDMNLIRNQRQNLRTELETSQKELATLRADLKAAREQQARLLTALKPFATFWDETLADTIKEDLREDAIWYRHNTHSLYYRDLKQAASAVAAESGKGAE